MRPLEILALVLVISAVTMWWIWVRASRLDRLHRKVVAARSAVELQLVRRATVAAELASSGLLDPASAVVVNESAWQVLTIASEEPATDLQTVPGRDAVESQLTWALGEVLGDCEEVDDLRADVVGNELVAALSAAWYRAQLARRFHNEAVSQAQRVRRGRMVRWLRLAGYAPMPVTLELDDTWPPCLPGGGVQ